MMDRERWTAAMGLGFFLLRSGTRTYVGHTGGMPGHITGLFTDRESKTGGLVLTNSGTHARHRRRSRSTLADRVTEHDPVEPEPWRPGTAVPAELADLRRGLVLRGQPVRVHGPRRAASRRAPTGCPSTSRPRASSRSGPDLFRTVAGREDGELLRVTRDADGRVRKMNWATYLVTREPLAFGEWL